MDNSLRLFLFSDHRIETARPMDDHLLKVAGKASPSVGWIPAGAPPEKLQMFVDARRAYYAELGIRDFDMFPLHADYDASRLPWLLERDIIHLSGGDPYLFLRNLRGTGLLEILRKWARAGGSLVGDSGGAMMMTPSLGIARFDSKPVPDDMRDSSALGLVDFEVDPHFGSYGGSAEKLQAYASHRRITVYGIEDGAALSWINGKMGTHGRLACFTP